MAKRTKARRKGKAKPAAPVQRSPAPLFLAVIHNGEGEELRLLYPDDVDNDELGLRIIYSLGYLAARFNTAKPAPDPAAPDVPMFLALERVRALTAQMADAVAVAKREMEAHAAREAGPPPAPRADA